jgi:hypothetical protein
MRYALVVSLHGIAQLKCITCSALPGVRDVFWSDILYEDDENDFQYRMRSLLEHGPTLRFLDSNGKFCSW